jgi:hypothetical protein
MSRFPDFIIIGAGKCGTTSLHDYLNQHPDIYLCPKKETFFFINERARENHQKWGSVTSTEEYLDLFKGAPEHSILGEISTNYYAYPESAELIQKAIPNVKIIAILRDPSDRAFSSYQMFVRNGHESRSFSEVINTPTQHTTRGFYFQELKPFYNVFSSQNIKVLLFDDLNANPEAFFRDLFEFVGAESTFAPDTSKRGREGGLPKQRWLNKLLTQHNPVRTVAASVMKGLVPLEKRQQLRAQLVNGNIAKQTLDQRTRAQLIDVYRDDIQHLQTLIDRDLSSWLS